jgi:hypothetical protein
MKMRVRKTHRRLALLGTAIAVVAFAALMVASTAVASTNLKAAHVGASSTDFKQSCTDAPSDEGVWWHFVLVGTTAINSGELTATFQSAGTVGPSVYYKQSGGVLHWYLQTPTDDILTGAVTTSDGRQLNLSHVCNGDGEPNENLLTVRKFYDANANGVWDAGEPELFGWAISIAGPGFSGDTTTAFQQLVAWGEYTVLEYSPNESNWVHSTPTLVDVTVGPNDAYAEFGNYCTRASGGLTLGFWSNKNGGARLSANSNLILNQVLALNLRKANGALLGSVSLSVFQKFLTDASATNMANMLSAQLAAMKANVLYGNVDGSSFVLGYGGTVNQLIADANASLGLYGNTPSGHPQRAYQESLKNYLDALNNGGNVVPATPCAYTFAS